jgi:hypothetical protein
MVCLPVSQSDAAYETSETSAHDAELPLVLANAVVEESPVSEIESVSVVTLSVWALLAAESWSTSEEAVAAVFVGMASPMVEEVAA